MKTNNMINIRDVFLALNISHTGVKSVEILVYVIENKTNGQARPLFYKKNGYVDFRTHYLYSLI